MSLLLCPSLAVPMKSQGQQRWCPLQGVLNQRSLNFPSPRVEGVAQTTSALYVSAFVRKTGRSFPGLKRLGVSLTQLDSISKS